MLQGPEAGDSKVSDPPKHATNLRHGEVCQPANLATGKPGGVREEEAPPKL